MTGQASSLAPGEPDTPRLIPILTLVTIFSMAANLLMLTGPIFMLQVYDRVLGSQSRETLLALFLLTGFLYGCMALLDQARGRLLARLGQRLSDSLAPRVYDAVLERTRGGRSSRETALAFRDLEALAQASSSPAASAIFDLPWVPVFIGALFLFHPYMGWLATAAAGLVLLVSLLNQVASRKPRKDALERSTVLDRLSSLIQSDSDTIRGLGMRGTILARWQAARQASQSAGLVATDRVGAFSSFSKAFRLFLQSAMLALGALLVLEGYLTGGAMIAGSILMGRALAPIDQLISGWPALARGRSARANLKVLLAAHPETQAPLRLPRPQGSLAVAGLAVGAPGGRKPLLQQVSFRLAPGQAIGLIGSSGAGKSTLARAVAGVWDPLAGEIRLGGALLSQYHPDDLGRLIGYLPQDVRLIEGTIAQNISRFDPGARDEEIVAAAERADAHKTILSLPDGYETRIGSGGSGLSGGQVQRIGLARALYGNPVLLVLDEPNANLDMPGSEAVLKALRQHKTQGGAAVVVAHRPAAIGECDLLMHIENGRVQAVGPRDKVLASQTRMQSRPAAPTAPQKGSAQ